MTAAPHGPSATSESLAARVWRLSWLLMWLRLFSRAWAGGSWSRAALKSIIRASGPTPRRRSPDWACRWLPDGAQGWLKDSPQMVLARLAGGVFRGSRGGALAVSDHAGPFLAGSPGGIGADGFGDRCPFGVARAVGPGQEGWGWASVLLSSGRAWSGPSILRNLAPGRLTRSSSRPRPSTEQNPTPNSASFVWDVDTVVHASEGSLMVRLNSLSVSVTPLLTFLSGSDDGCWSVIARAADRAGPVPRLRLITTRRRAVVRARSTIFADRRRRCCGMRTRAPARSPWKPTRH